MKAIMVMYDSLNRHLMPNYGCRLIHMPNFGRLAERAVTFDNCYVGSMPCMPARREIHTGRYNFLHRSWGPMEPFDDSMPAILKANGIHTHLATDHYHYFEDGGATYHNRYSTWGGYRGQESDKWMGSLEKAEPSQVLSLKKLSDGLRQFREKGARQNMINRKFMPAEKDYPQSKTFANGLDFIERNHSYDNWFVQIETFDPHEPFTSPDDYQRMYADKEGKLSPYDWPPYARVTETPQEVEAMRRKYYALASMCDRNLGRVLDMMDKYDMWKDTMLIVNTDHGFLLGEHGWWAKNVMPLYNELAHIPLFIWDPRCGCHGERRRSLVQTIDLAPTLLDYFEAPIPESMQGKTLKDVIAGDRPVRKYALYGYHGDAINITNGRYVYMRGPVRPDGGPLYEYTLMPTHMAGMFSAQELQNMELSGPFSFTKNCRLLKIGVTNSRLMPRSYQSGNQLFDLAADPGQMHALDDPAKEVELLNEMKKLMRESDAPSEQYERVGIPLDGEMAMGMRMEQRKQRK